MITLRRLDKLVSDYLPLEKIYYTLLVVYLSIATNDIQLSKGSFLRNNYIGHIVVIFVLSYMSLVMNGKHIFGPRVLSAFIVTFVFYMVTKPDKYNIFSSNFYNKLGIFPAT